VPDAGGLSRQQAGALDEYVKGGGRALLSGQVPPDLACLGPAKHVETRTVDKAGYIRIRPEDRKRLGAALLDRLDLVFLRGQFHVYETGKDVEGLLRLIPPDMFGPPEKCYYRHVSEHPALLYRRHGEGTAACFTFGIGAHYQEQAHQGHAALLLGAIDHLLHLERRVQVSASPLVEIAHRADRDGRFESISLYNHSGRRGSALHAPVPMADIRVRFKGQKPVQRVRLLHAGRELEFTEQDERIVTVVPRLDHYEIIVFEYPDNRG